MSATDDDLRKLHRLIADQALERAGREVDAAIAAAWELAEGGAPELVASARELLSQARQNLIALRCERHVETITVWVLEVLPQASELIDVAHSEADLEERRPESVTELLGNP